MDLKMKKILATAIAGIIGGVSLAFGLITPEQFHTIVQLLGLGM